MKEFVMNRKIFIERSARNPLSGFSLEQTVSGDAGWIDRLETNARAINI